MFLESLLLIIKSNYKNLLILTFTHLAQILTEFYI
jgi:hypothetical protein